MGQNAVDMGSGLDMEAVFEGGRLSSDEYDDDDDEGDEDDEDDDVVERHHVMPPRPSPAHHQAVRNAGGSLPKAVPIRDVVPRPGSSTGSAAPSRAGPGSAAPSRAGSGSAAPSRAGSGSSASSRAGSGSSAPSRAGSGSAAPSRIPQEITDRLVLREQLREKEKNSQGVKREREGEKDIAKHTDSKKANVEPDDPGWTCSQCTFINLPYLLFCEQCEKKRPDQHKFIVLD